MLRPLADGHVAVAIEGETARAVVQALIIRFPRLQPHLLDEHGNLRSHLAVAVDGEVMAADLREPLQGNPEIHFVMAIKGGSMRSRRQNSGAIDRRL